MVDRVGASYLHFDIQPGVPISLAGPAKVIDDDTIVVAGQLVRLYGIYSPELDLRQALGVARIITAAAHAGIRLGYGR